MPLKATRRPQLTLGKSIRGDFVVTGVNFGG
eukprot:COSAG01_NODE_59442_length_300_cov_0.771144_1_plen_30_part_01